MAAAADLLGFVVDFAANGTAQVVDSFLLRYGAVVWRRVLVFLRLLSGLLFERLASSVNLRDIVALVILLIICLPGGVVFLPRSIMCSRCGALVHGAGIRVFVWVDGARAGRNAVRLRTISDGARWLRVGVCLRRVRVLLGFLGLFRLFCVRIWSLASCSSGVRIVLNNRTDLLADNISRCRPVLVG